MLKKMEGNVADFFKALINDSDAIIELEGKKYQILFNPITSSDDDTDIKTLISRLDADPEIREMIEQSEKDIAEGRVYSTKEAIEAIKRGEF